MKVKEYESNGLSVKITEDGLNRFAEIKPKGFWLSVVDVCQRSDFWTFKLETPLITWGSGGTNGKISNLEATKCFKKALEEAIKISILWKKDVGKVISQGEIENEK